MPKEILYHLTKEGPKECNAKIVPCPKGGRHFTDFQEAEVEFSKMMGFQVIPTNKKDSFSMSLTPATQKIINTLDENNVQALIVGGSVRDNLLGIESKDIDLELYGQDENGESLQFNNIASMFNRQEGFKVDQAGASFSVLKVRYKGEDFDLALPRKETSTGAGHTDYELQHDSRMDFAEAASRRDFTINAMGYDAAKGELIDPYDGEKDLNSKILRHVSPAFSDDPLRALRGINFASRFGFKMAPETQELCRELSEHYPTLAKERIEEEFNKVFYKGKHCGLGFSTLYDIGWAEKMPGFRKVKRDKLKHYGSVIDFVPKGMARKAVLTKMMIDDKKESPVEVIENYVNGRKYIDSFGALIDANRTGHKGDIVSAHRDFKEKSGMSNKDIKRCLIAMREDTSSIDTLPEKPVEPVLTGKKLMEKGFPPGPEMGKIIKKAQKIQDNESIYDFDVLLARSLQY